MGERSRYGLAVSTLGAAVLAVSVFLPWYGVSLTAGGAAAAGQAGDRAAAQVGGAMPSLMASLHARISSLTGQELTALSAHDALKEIGVLLLVLAALALLDSLLPLARSASAVPYGAGGATVVLGLVACACVLYRMLDVPAPTGGFVALSVREGAWLALAGSVAIVLGGLWPRDTAGREERQADVWASLSGWSPQA